MNQGLGGATVLFITNDPSSEEGDFVKLFLQKERGDRVILCKPDQQQIQHILEQNFPDLIIINAQLQEVTLFEANQRIRSIPALEKTPVLFWRVAVEPAKFYPKAQEVGAAGCIDFYIQPEKLLAARDTILRGDTFYP